VPHKSLYQDRLILVSEGPYSGVSASALGLTDAAWRRLSLLIRIEHECTHYFTRRVLGAMSNNLLDELAADCMGLIGATGTYPASWFLHFVGLEAAPVYRAGGRLENYRGAPPLSDSAFAVLGRLVVAAAEHLEAYLGPRAAPEPVDRAALLLALTRLSLEDLAAPDAGDRLAAAHSWAGTRVVATPAGHEGA
ncbi:MAG TPA: hypothetical protein VM536_15945, partial [Chloroflexia bacterium]|nr:hypothetical protein [Chloroflexia bacterium]